METRRWLNPAQPQTLQIAVFLLYAQSVLLLLFGGYFHFVVLLLLAGAGVAAGYGIANEQKWGWRLGVVVAIAPIALKVVVFGIADTITSDFVNLMFEIALVVALLHPQSRDYQRIWFK
jgi:hypothetical protein